MRSTNAKTVLIVDDDPKYLAFLETALAEAFDDLVIVTAGSGAEALALLGTFTASALITDYDMPNMNGLELMNQLKAKAISLPVFLTVFDPDSGSQHPRVKETAGVFEKWVGLKSLIDALRKVVS